VILHRARPLSPDGGIDDVAIIAQIPPPPLIFSVNTWFGSGDSEFSGIADG